MTGYKVRIDERKLSQILHALSELIGYHIRFYSSMAERWVGKPEENLPFCRLMESDPLTNERCVHCDEEADRRCRASKTAFSYHCHVSLLEVVCPVYYKDVYVGYLNIGQFRDRSKSLSDRQMSEMSRLLDVEEALLRKRYEQHPQLSKTALEGAMMLEEMCVMRLLEARVFSIDYKETVSKIERYIRAHLSSELTLKEISRVVYMNPSYLSTLYHKATGMTLFQFIQQQRVEHACYLFRTTRMTREEVAAAVGYQDPNYFSKVFKKEKGMTPREYRRKWTAGEILI